MTEEAAITLKKLMALCSRSEKCEYDALQYMTRHGASKEDAALAVEYLVANRFVDNQRYALAYTADKFKFARWGAHKIAAALKAKRIPDACISEAIGQIVDPKSENQTLANELAKKLRGIKNETKQKTREKLIRFAIARGYPTQRCISIINSLLSGTISDNSN